jgi:hypothetical protein
MTSTTPPTTTRASILNIPAPPVPDPKQTRLFDKPCGKSPCSLSDLEAQSQTLAAGYPTTPETKTPVKKRKLKNGDVKTVENDSSSSSTTTPSTTTGDKKDEERDHGSKKRVNTRGRHIHVIVKTRDSSGDVNYDIYSAQTSQVSEADKAIIENAGYFVREKDTNGPAHQLLKRIKCDQSSTWKRVENKKAAKQRFTMVFDDHSLKDVTDPDYSEDEVTADTDVDDDVDDKKH